MNDFLRTKLLLIPFLTFFAVFFVFCSGGPDVVEHGVFAPSRLDYVIGQDGVCSIPFDDATTLWTFADTITGRWKSEGHRKAADKDGAVMENMLSNSIAWSEKISLNNFRDIRLKFYTENGKAAQFIKNRKSENPLHHRFWALDGIRIGSCVYVFYLHVYIPDHSKFLDFRVLYTGLARWDIPKGWKSGDTIDFRRLGIIFNEGEPYFGAAVLEHNGYIYLAGHSKRDGRFPLSFARVRPGEIEKRVSYTFLTEGGKWDESLKHAGEFFGDVSGEPSLSYNDYQNCYIVIYSKIFSGDVVVVKFNDFSKLPEAAGYVVHRPQLFSKSGMWSYSGKEIFSSGNSIFLIYIDPDKYQPVLSELRY